MIKKFIWIINALQVMERLIAGKRLAGELYIDAETGKLTFKAFDRSKKRRRDRLIRSLEHGWVKESPARYKFFESIPICHLNLLVKNCAAAAFAPKAAIPQMQFGNT